MLNGDIFSELFLSNLDEKITSAGYVKGKQRNKLSCPIIYWYLPCGVSHAKRIYSLTLDNFSLSSQQLVPNYCLYPSKSSDVHRLILTIILCPGVAILIIFLRKCQNPHPMPDPPLGLDIGALLFKLLR